MKARCLWGRSFLVSASAFVMDLFTASAQTLSKFTSSKVVQVFVLHLPLQRQRFFSPYFPPLLFIFPPPWNHHSINIPPRYKVLMSACLLRLTRISPKVLRGRHWRSCLHIPRADVVELLSSLDCPLISLQDAWWQRWGRESCVSLRGGGSAPWRVACNGRARPGPCAALFGASSVSTASAPGRCREGTQGAVMRLPQLQSGTEYAKTAHWCRSHRSYNICDFLKSDVPWRWKLFVQCSSDDLLKKKSILENTKIIIKQVIFFGHSNTLYIGSIIHSHHNHTLMWQTMEVKGLQRVHNSTGVLSTSWENPQILQISTKMALKGHRHPPVWEMSLFNILQWSTLKFIWVRVLWMLQTDIHPKQQTWRRYNQTLSVSWPLQLDVSKAVQALSLTYTHTHTHPSKASPFLPE